MFSRSTGWFICLFVAVAAARDYKEPISILGSDPGGAVNRVRNGNEDWSVMELDHKFEETASNTRLLVDRTFLAARNPAVAAMLQRHAMDTCSGQGAVPDVEDPIMRQLMTYLHTLQASELPQMAPWVFPPTHTYSEPNLKVECEEQVAGQLSVENAVEKAVHAINHSCNNAKQAAVEYIEDHMAQVLNSQGWAHAVLTQPEEVVLLSRLLSARLAVSRSQVNMIPRTMPTTQPDNGNSEHSDTSSSTAMPMTTCPTSPLDDDEISFFRRLSEEEGKGKRLIDAAKQEDVEEVRTLLAAGVFPGKRDGLGRTALHWLARYGYAEAARCLLDAGADVDTADYEEYRPLHMAAVGGHPAMMRLLASVGANPDPQDIWGWTPLHLTVREQKPEAAMALLEVGADRKVSNKNGFTPLDMARRSNNQPLMDVLTQS